MNCENKTARAWLSVLPTYTFEEKLRGLPLRKTRVAGVSCEPIYSDCANECPHIQIDYRQVPVRDPRAYFNFHRQLLGWPHCLLLRSQASHLWTSDSSFLEGFYVLNEAVEQLGAHLLQKGPEHDHVLFCFYRAHMRSLIEVIPRGFGYELQSRPDMEALVGSLFFPSSNDSASSAISKLGSGVELFPWQLPPENNPKTLGESLLNALINRKNCASSTLAAPSSPTPLSKSANPDSSLQVL